MKLQTICIVLALACLIPGCGQAPYQPPPRLVEYPDDEPAPAAKTEGAKVAATLAPPAPAQKAVAKPAAPIVSGGRDGDDDTPGIVPVVKPDFPLDFGDWLPDDFKRARKRRSAKLLQAVRELGTGNVFNPDSELNAKLLGELLEAPPEEKAVAPPPKKVAVGYDDEPVAVSAPPTAIPGLGPAIVEVLGANGAAEARATLKRILLGKQPSDIDDRTLCVATLKTLVEHCDHENEKVVLAVLTVPDSIRPAGRPQYTADQLHDDCLKAVRPTATAEFRLKLAQRMARGVSSSASRKRVMSLLLSADRLNIPAKVELEIDGIADATERQALERDLFQSSQQTNEQLFRANAADWDGASTAPVTPVRNGYDDAAQLVPLATIAASAPHLWRKDFLTAVAARVAAEEELESRDSLMQLATSLPSDLVRTALLRRWKMNWADEANSLGNIGNAFLDPGLVVVFKQLPRETQVPNPRGGVRQYPDTAQGQKMAKEAAAKKSWLRLSETYTRSLLERCRQFAEHRSATTAGPDKTQSITSVADFDQFLNSSASASNANLSSKSDVTESRSFELNLRHPKDARPKSVYRASWPEDLLGKLDNATVSPIELGYLRLEVDGDPDSIVSGYSRQLKSPVARQVENGRWLDSLKSLDDGRIASTDVLITRADRGSETATRGATEKLVVEILRVAVPDMSTKTPPAATVSQQP
jgi:hypothetical protein